jgi:hypothetical protein
MSQKLTDRNPHTGEKLQTKQTSDAYRSNYDTIFRKKDKLWSEIPEDEVVRLTAFLTGRQCPVGGIYWSDYEEFKASLK